MCSYLTLVICRRWKVPIKNAGFSFANQAAVERDPANMLELITEINNLLEEKEKRLEEKRKVNPHPADL